MTVTDGSLSRLLAERINQLSSSWKVPAVDLYLLIFETSRGIRGLGLFEIVQRWLA